MNDNIKKAAEDILCKAGWYDLNVNSGNYKIPLPYVISFMESLATSEAAREYWERGPEKQEGEMYVNVYKNTQGEPHNGAIYYSITEAVEMGIGAGYVGTYRLVKVETNQNE